MFVKNNKTRSKDKITTTKQPTNENNMSLERGGLRKGFENHEVNISITRKQETKEERNSEKDKGKQKNKNGKREDEILKGKKGEDNEEDKKNAKKKIRRRRRRSKTNSFEERDWGTEKTPVKLQESGLLCLLTTKEPPRKKKNKPNKWKG